MKLAFQIAYKNLIGSGLRTWLNVIVLSFVFVVIIFFNGLIDGWNQQSLQESIKWEYANGYLLNNDYDPNDAFTIADGHGHLPDSDTKNLTPVLIRQATIYPQGRLKSVLLKGIPAGQETIALPTASLDSSHANIPVLIGKRMAETAKLKEGDQVLMRWRDKNGTFDAADVTVHRIFDTSVASVDNGQIWMPVERLWELTGLHGQATLYIADSDFQTENFDGWNFESQDELLQDFRDLIEMKKVSGNFMYIILLFIALIAIFDTQVLSIFRRQKEIGTYVAMGMTKMQVLRLFTVEGAMYSVFGVVLGMAYGIPLFIVLSRMGITLPEFYQDMGVNLPRTIYPVFGVELIVLTVLALIISATLVSLIPARKIARMDPVMALKGKIQ